MVATIDFGTQVYLTIPDKYLNHREEIAWYAAWQYCQVLGRKNHDDQPLESKDLKVTWFNYTAGYWKALVAAMNSGYYYEVTYILKEDRIIVDEYKQTKHVEITPRW